MPSSKPVALVTGAQRGIGFGVAKKLAQDGYDLAINDVQSEEKARAALEELRAFDVGVLYCRADVSDPDARSGMLAEIKEHFGRLNVLVNNAGVAPKARADILEAREENFEWLMKVNLQGPYFLTQAVANYLIEQRGMNPEIEGCIVNVSSVSATVASPSRGEYCISKAGVSMATKLWATRLGEFDIPVYEIRPGIIKTDMTTPVIEKYDKLIAEGLLVQPRWGVPEDIAKAVSMLVREDCPYSTGQVILVDGGMTLQRL